MSKKETEEFIKNNPSVDPEEYKKNLKTKKVSKYNDKGLEDLTK